MLISVKSGFRRWPLLIFALLLLTLSGCIAENSDDAVKMEAVEDATGEENSFLESNGDILSVSEGTTKGLDAPPLVAQTDQQTIIPTEWLSHAWKGFERSENCQADNNNLPQTNFTDSSICELQNFKLFLDRFSEDVDFQISVAKFPLKLTTIVPTYCKEIEDLIPIEEIVCFNLLKRSNKFPIFPIKEQREHERLIHSYV